MILLIGSMNCTRGEIAKAVLSASAHAARTRCERVPRIRARNRLLVLANERVLVDGLAYRDPDVALHNLGAKVEHSVTCGMKR